MIVRPIQNDPGLYHDPNTDTVRRKGDRSADVVKTAVQIVMARVEAPPPPLIVLPDIPPLETDVTARAAGNGHNRKHAEYQVREQIKLEQARQRTISPEFAATTEELHAKGIKALTEAAERVRHQAGRVAQVEEWLKARADLLRQASADSGSLAAAKAALDDGPTALALSEEKLFALNNQVRHSPQRIADAKRKAALLTTQLLEVAADGKIDLAALIASLYEQSGPLPGTTAIRDRNLRTLIEAGYFGPA